VKICPTYSDWLPPMVEWLRCFLLSAPMSTKLLLFQQRSPGPPGRV
jgi:hypothetical protein